MTTTPTFDWTAAISSRGQRLSASAIREILKITQRPEVISFAGGLPAPELFPLGELRTAFDTVMTKYGPAAVQYSTTEGHLPLRQWIAEQAGITPEHVQIMTGSQQSLDLVGKMLISEGDVVLVESPTYLGALQSFAPYGPRYVELPTDEGGIDVEALSDILKRERAKLLYAVPNFQNPTGRTLDLTRRRRLVELTREHGVVVFEDDPYGQLRFTGEALPSLYQIALEAYGPEDSHVLYSSSFSKTLMPGLRDAWVQAARPMIAKLVQAKQGADLHTPTLNQMLIAELVEEVLPRQIEKIKVAYAERAGDMLARIKDYFPPGVSHTTPEGGMFLWASLPETIDTTALLPQAVERGVAFVPGAPFFAGGGGHNTMRLSYSCATPEQIDRGIQALAETIKNALD